MPMPVEITRTLPVRKQELFNYFITPGLVEKWAFPTGMSLRVPRMEAHPGGKYIYEHTLPGGGTYVADGHFEELSPDRIVQIDERIKDPSGKVMQKNLRCSITFRELGGSTKATIVQEGFRDEKMAEECRQGWEQCLSHLEHLIRTQEVLSRPA